MAKYKHEFCFAEKMINSNAHFGDKTSDYMQYLQRVIATRVQNDKDAFNQKCATMLAHREQQIKEGTSIIPAIRSHNLHMPTSPAHVWRINQLKVCEL